MKKSLYKLVVLILSIFVLSMFTACINDDTVFDDATEDVFEDDTFKETEEDDFPDEDEDDNIDEPIIEIPPLPDNSPIHPDQDLVPDEKEEIIEISKIDEVEEYLDMVYKTNINRVWFSTYSNITQYYGYIFLYGGVEITPVEEFVNVKYKNTRPGIIRTKIDYIVIHDTANNASSANAKKHSTYINSNPGVSWHYTVDMEGIFHQIPDNEVAYHAGDGLRVSGSTYYNTTYKKTSITGGNMNGIGIETCVNSGSDYGTTLFNTANLVSDLMIKYNLDISDIKRHYDFSGKMCPQALIKSGGWDEFLEYVKICYFYKTELDDVSIKFKSMSSYMDDLGRISLKTPKGSNIKYKAVIEYEGQVLEYEFLTQVI